MNDFEKVLAGYQEEGLYARQIDILQVNVGLLCNQTCSHCHLECGPNRTEVMGWQTMEQLLEVASLVRPRVFDITGGAPELNPHVRDLVRALSQDGHKIQLRTNLTAMTEPGMDDLPEFLREQRVKIVASLPCYTEENVMNQRGAGAYEKSIRSLKLLNEVGYTVDPDLHMDLVYNPGGTALPASQPQLETAYRRELFEQYNISFSRLLTITNMPIGRYRTALRRDGRDVEYARLLKNKFNPGTLDHLMCRYQVSVGWDGSLYDCDFNLALGMSLNHGMPDKLVDVDIDSLASRRIITGEHCFGCTASYGSSCSGLLVGKSV